MFSTIFIALPLPAAGDCRAALGGHSEVSRVLIKAGADKNARTGGSGATPLHLSARRGHEECVRILLLTGADKDARRALDGATPLHQVHFIFLFVLFQWQ